jgi:hypothetical protein
VDAGARERTIAGGKSKSAREVCISVVAGLSSFQGLAQLAPVATVHAAAEKLFCRDEISFSD